MRAARMAAFFLVAAALTLAGYARLQWWQPVVPDIIGFGKDTEARAIAARYFGLGLNGIAGGYWDVWPAVFATEHYGYLIHASSTDVFGVTIRGDIRRNAFSAYLAARGRIRIGCIDIATTPCRDLVASIMNVPDIRAKEFAPPERLPNGHVLTPIEMARADPAYADVH